MILHSIDHKKCLFLVAAYSLIMMGCSREQNPSPKPSQTDANYYQVKNLESVDFYEQKLLDNTYRWHGPCSHEDRIPRLHAARALAYIGDPAVPSLLRACKNEKIDYPSVLDALQEIGLPVDQYLTENTRQDTAMLEKWWAENKNATVRERSQYRIGIGLPSIEHE